MHTHTEIAFLAVASHVRWDEYECLTRNVYKFHCQCTTYYRFNWIIFLAWSTLCRLAHRIGCGCVVMDDKYYVQLIEGIQSCLFSETVIRCLFCCVFMRARRRICVCVEMRCIGAPKRWIMNSTRGIHRDTIFRLSGMAEATNPIRTSTGKQNGIWGKEGGSAVNRRLEQI